MTLSNSQSQAAKYFRVKGMRNHAYQPIVIDGKQMQSACMQCGELQAHIVHKVRKTYINTVWAVRTYDVWGNARDGFEVNDSFSQGEVTIRCEVKTYNVGSPHQFDSATPSDSQVRRALGLRRFAIDTDGDDLTIYVNRSRDGYPCGELHCVSHESLSPIRVATPTERFQANRQ